MSENKDPFKLEGVKRNDRETLPFPWLVAVLTGLVALLGVIILTPIPEKIRRKLGFSSPPKPKIVIKEAPAPPPEIVVKKEIVEKVVKIRPAYYEVKANSDVAKTSKGFDFKSGIEERVGRLASVEREDDGTYEAVYTIKMNRPASAKNMEELKQVSPNLDKILPGLESMMEGAKVSPFFGKLYDNKAARLKSRGNRLDRLLTKHNYYDCQAMLEMEHPESKRKIFLIFTSYGWKKTGTVVNPMIAGWRRMLSKAQAKGDSREVTRLKEGIEDLQKRSFLIADYDPFIVMPVDVITDRESPYGPNVGDYVAVIYNDVIYPAIVGDGGPTFKVGEASLRMAKEINSQASSYHRPVSDVSVTYLVFPRTSGKWAAPDYHSWREECLKLLGEIGGLGEAYQLYQWANTLPVPEPEPERQVTPTEVPADN